MTEEKKCESIAVSYCFKGSGCEMFSSVSIPVPPGQTAMMTRMQVADELFNKMMEEFKIKCRAYKDMMEKEGLFASKTPYKSTQSAPKNQPNTPTSSMACPVCSAGMDRDKKDTKWQCKNRKWRKDGDNPWKNEGCNGEVK